MSKPGDYVPGVQKATTTLAENNPEYYAETQVKPYRDALDSIAEAYNSSTTNQQDIVNAVGKALRAAGYELEY